MHLAAEPCRTLASLSGFAFVEDSIGSIGIFNVSEVLTNSLFRSGCIRLPFLPPAEFFHPRLAREPVQ